MKPMIALGLALGVLIGVPGFAGAQQTILQKYCSNANPRAEILLIDHSEEYDDTDKRRFAAGMNRVFGELRPGRKLEVYLIKENANNFAAVFAACVPGCEDEIDPSESNWATVCSSLRTQQDKKSFQIAFVQVMRQLVTTSQNTGGSAILDTLAQLGVQYRDNQHTIERITIFSDMLEYSTHNKSINFFDADRAKSLLARSRRVIDEKAPFGTASVVIFGIGKRLGQERLVKEKTKREAELPRKAANASRGFWRVFFAEVLKIPRDKIIMTLNY